MKLSRVVMVPSKSKRAIFMGTLSSTSGGLVRLLSLFGALMLREKVS